MEIQTTAASQDMLDMIHRPITSELLSHVADQASLVIPCHSSYHSNNTERPPSIMDNKYGVLPSLSSFIGFLVKRSSVRTGTLLGSLVFLQRLQQTLSTIAKGMPCTSHRIFLATLIVTSKALHDTSPKNKHWAKYAAYFTLSEINLMEKQLLSLMNYHVLISPADLANAYYRFKQATSLPPSAPKPSFLVAPLPTYKQKKLQHSVLSSSKAAIPPQQQPPVPVPIVNEVDIPTYAAQQMYSSNLPSLVNDSQNSLSSENSDELIEPLVLPEPAHFTTSRSKMADDDYVLLSNDNTPSFLMNNNASRNTKRDQQQQRE